MNRGLFITLEGPDGSGKSTQLDFIREYFAEKSMTVEVSREPGGTPIGEKLREILLDRNNSEMSDIAETLIYAASRAQHVAEKIRPAVEAGRVFVCDRFIDSSIAYQGYGRGLGDRVLTVNLIAVDGLMPDVTFFLDIAPEKGLARIARNRGEADRLEREKLDFHYRLYEGYRAMADAYPDRIKAVDADRDIEEIKADIRAHLDEICRVRGL